jgi:hypothetical protein
VPRHWLTAESCKYVAASRVTGTHLKIATAAWPLFWFNGSPVQTVPPDSKVSLSPLRNMYRYIALSSDLCQKDFQRRSFERSQSKLQNKCAAAEAFLCIRRDVIQLTSTMYAAAALGILGILKGKD